MKQVFLTRAQLNRLANLGLVVIGPAKGTPALFLSERNVRTLLSKLDRQAAGEHTSCTLIKNDTKHPKYPCDEAFAVTAVEEPRTDGADAWVNCVEDDQYYAHRAPGIVHPADDPGC